jgi:hypothetical protein
MSRVLARAEPTPCPPTCQAVRDFTSDREKYCRDIPMIPMTGSVLGRFSGSIGFSGGVGLPGETEKFRALQ